MRRQIQIVVLVLAFALAVPLAMLDAPTSTAHAASDLLPDLRMASLPATDGTPDIKIQNTDPGYPDNQKRLRFSTIIVNVGHGPFEVHGERPDTSTLDKINTVTQRIYNDANGFRDLPTSGEMVYAGDGHIHWHLYDLQRSTLALPKHGATVATGIKRGFCFFDNVPHPGTTNRFYTNLNSCARGDENALNVMMGLSVGWGDIYDFQLPDQYIDITGLTDGRYRLTTQVDKDNRFKESNEKNNKTWTDIEITGDNVSVIKQGPSA